MELRNLNLGELVSGRTSHLLCTELCLGLSSPSPLGTATTVPHAGISEVGERGRKTRWKPRFSSSPARPLVFTTLSNKAWMRSDLLDYFVPCFKFYHPSPCVSPCCTIKFPSWDLFPARKTHEFKIPFFLHLYQAYMGKKSKNKDQSTECFDENYRFRTSEKKSAFVAQREVLHLLGDSAQLQHPLPWYKWSPGLYQKAWHNTVKSRT